MNDYLKISKSKYPPLSINYSYIQTFNLDPIKSKALNEGYIIRTYLAEDENLRNSEFELMRFLAKFWFATRSQIERFFKEKGIKVEDLDKFLDNLVNKQSLNYFVLASAPLIEIPADAERFYCLGLGARYILSHFYREDFVYWKAVDNARSSEQVIKCVSTVEFYLHLLKSKNSNLRAFEPIFNAPIGTRDTRFSAYIEVKGENLTRRFILESVREADLPVYFRKKVVEQISPFLGKGYFKKTMPTQPEFIFLCENLEDAKEAADIYYRCFEKSDFFVTTDDELKKGFENAAFYKYDGENLIQGQIQAFL